MNRHVNAIAGRLSLRPPQRRSLEILDRIAEIVPPKKGADIAAALEVIRSEYGTVADFEREFPSLCFALATGVGKTRLMGAFIAYLHLAHGLNNFFVLAPNLTIYDKLVRDFQPGNPKYVFSGISEFAVEPPEIITGDNYERPVTLGFYRVSINIFNVSKLTSEVRGGKPLKMRRPHDYFPDGYFDYLASLPDLVLLMDESHRYRASAGVRAINELKPIIGLELTATPFVESPKGPVPFRNVVFDYPLAKAMADGFVKEPAVVTQKNFQASQFAADALEEIKLKDGIRVHESTKVELQTYANQTGQRLVKPFMLIIARDITHAVALLKYIESAEFFEARYKGKAIQVDSSKTGADEEKMIQDLLAVESTESPVEIVIHVNMLKEGWDVTNLYTIVPLRAANARTLIEQSIGRGLRLPYGKRTGVEAVDRLNIIAHDRFQEIIDEANRADSIIRLQQVILEPETKGDKPVSVVSSASIMGALGFPETTPSSATGPQPSPPAPAFATAQESKVAQLAYEIIQQQEKLPSSAALSKPEITAEIVRQLENRLALGQQSLAGIEQKTDNQAIVAKTISLIKEKTIDIPRIIVVPKGEVSTGFNSFKLQLSQLNLQPGSREIITQELRTNKVTTLAARGGAIEEDRLEDYIVGALIDKDDIHYDSQADLLYELAGQVVTHLRSYLKDEKEVVSVLQDHHKRLANEVHSQMQTHRWEKSSGYVAEIRSGISRLKDCAYTAIGNEALDFRTTVPDKSRLPKLLFAGFKRCLYDWQKFHSDPERKMALILDREAEKWFRPAKGQFKIDYKLGLDIREYQPDFVAETSTEILMIEVKARNELTDAEVIAKKEAASVWCGHATAHTDKNGGKPWRYIGPIPDDSINDNMELKWFVSQFAAGITAAA
jgi:type III restriction enzyme